jgi:hypothetical protein
MTRRMTVAAGVTPAEHRAVRDVAKARGMTVCDLVRDALGLAVDHGGLDDVHRPDFAERPMNGMFEFEDISTEDLRERAAREEREYQRRREEQGR